MFQNIKRRMNSDRAASMSVETILFVALSVFAVMMIINYIIKPMQTTSEGIGATIKDMDPTE